MTMDRLLASTALWAMHPDYLSALLKQGSIEAMLPEALRSLMTLGGPAQAKAAPDPIREGATVIMRVSGVLAPSSVYRGGTCTAMLGDRIREFGADGKVGAIILACSSPGGLVYGTKECGDAIFEARQLKPVVAVAEPFAFSACHWLACQASAFYAAPSADVGSVGVRSGHTDVSIFEEKIGMRTTLIASDPDKIHAHPYAPLSDEDRAVIQADVDEINQVFIADIARGRGMPKADVPKVHGKGMIFSARRAAETGITDGVMTLREVVAKYASSRARLDLMRRQAALLGQVAAI